ARIAATIMPIPPYYTRIERPAQDPAQPHPRIQRNAPNPWDFHSIPNTIVTHDHPLTIAEDAPPIIDGGIPMPPGSIPIVDTPSGPNPPPPTRTAVDQPRIVHKTQLDPAMLIHRVEPIYPVLMKQIGRSGQVQLRAIIGTDGSVQSLQVVSGDPGFYRSALE